VTTPLVGRRRYPAGAAYGGLAAEGYYVRNIYSTVSNAFAGQDAQYLEDRWQVTKDVLVTVGVRREGFYNANQDGTKYIEMKNQSLPRVNVAWDVNGDSSFKVFGSAGRYTIQIPTWSPCAAPTVRCTRTSTSPTPAPMRTASRPARP
jgi:outer membrane receptor protein involved in Fe transport